jgi:hypothetical protein
VELEMYDYTGSNWSHWNNNKVVRKYLKATPGKHSVDSLDKTAMLGTSHIVWTIQQSATGRLSLWFKKSAREKRPVTRDQQQQQQHNNNDNNTNTN